MPDPRCPFCRRAYTDARGCMSSPEELEPVLYGAEQNPISSGPTCRDCGAPSGTMHHVACSCAECPQCHQQAHGGEMSCEENRQLTMGGAA